MLFYYFYFYSIIFVGLAVNIEAVLNKKRISQYN